MVVHYYSLFDSIVVLMIFCLLSVFVFCFKFFLHVNGYFDLLKRKGINISSILQPCAPGAPWLLSLGDIP